jgi:hypothetical protein
MTFACARALRVCALLALPASAFAQSPRSPTVFSPETQVGTVNVRAAMVLTDYTIKPLPLLKVVARRVDRPDSVSAETDLDGRATMSLRVGTYNLRAKTAQPVNGQSYAWNVRVVVRPNKLEQVQLTNSNALTDSIPKPAVVAAAPTVTPPAASPASQPIPVAKPATKPPPQPAPVQKKIVAAPVDSSKRTVAVTPPPAPAPVPESQPSPFAVPPSPAPVSVQPATPAQHATPKPRATPAPMPRANTNKLLLGLSFDASSIKSDDLNSSTESGAGMAAQLGWGFTKNFALVLDASAARIASLNGDFDLAHVDVGGRWHFVSMRSGLVPFVEVGYSGRAATKQGALMTDGAGNMYTGDLSILGGGVSLGGGFHYFVAPTWAIGGALKWTTGQFSRVQFDNVSVDGFQIDATSARFNMGFTWFPMGRDR